MKWSSIQDSARTSGSVDSMKISSTSSRRFPNSIRTASLKRVDGATPSRSVRVSGFPPSTRTRRSDHRGAADLDGGESTRMSSTVSDPSSGDGMQNLEFHSSNLPAGKACWRSADVLDTRPGARSQLQDVSGHDLVDCTRQRLSRALPLREGSRPGGHQAWLEGSLSNSSDSSQSTSWRACSGLWNTRRPASCTARATDEPRAAPVTNAK